MRVEVPFVVQAAQTLDGFNEGGQLVESNGNVKGLLFGGNDEVDVMELDDFIQRVEEGCGFLSRRRDDEVLADSVAGSGKIPAQTLGHVNRVARAMEGAGKFEGGRRAPASEQDVGHG